MALHFVLLLGRRYGNIQNSDSQTICHIPCTLNLQFIQLTFTSNSSNKTFKTAISLYKQISGLSLKRWILSNIILMQISFSKTFNKIYKIFGIRNSSHFHTSILLQFDRHVFVITCQCDQTHSQNDVRVRTTIIQYLIMVEVCKPVIFRLAKSTGYHDAFNFPKPKSNSWPEPTENVLDMFPEKPPTLATRKMSAIPRKIAENGTRTGPGANTWT